MVAVQQDSRGGKTPVVVLDDADLDLAAEGILQGAFGSTGQRCTATSRVVATPGISVKLAEALAEKARKIRVGNGMTQGVQMGPAVDTSQLRTDLDAIAAARSEGARLLCGGERLSGAEHEHGFFVAPTVFDDVEPGTRLAREEVFGPVLGIMRARDAEEAIRYANDVQFGLTASIYTRDYFEALRFVEKAEVGMVHVNQPTVGGEAQLPFGGIKATGVGEKEMAEEGANFFTHLKTVWLDYTGAKRTSNIYSARPATSLRRGRTGSAYLCPPVRSPDAIPWRSPSDWLRGAKKWPHSGARPQGRIRVS